MLLLTASVCRRIWPNWVSIICTARIWPRQRPFASSKKRPIKASKTAKRQRDRLSQAFIDAYETEILSQFEPQSLLDDLPPAAEVVALFCVEREPAACHRSLVAQKLAQAFNIPIIDIRPET
jgi:hypothetical protein